MHGCISNDCKRKLMDCLELTRKYKAVEATMKKVEESSDTYVDASYAQDNTKKPQRNGSRKMSYMYRPKSKPDGASQTTEA